jgi:hydrogenase maturation protease
VTLSVDKVLALGQPMAGDDGFGLLVIEALRRRGLERVKLEVVRDTSDIVQALLDGGHTIIVDAVLGTPEGEVLVLDPTELDRDPESRVSSHGLPLADALRLAQQLGSPGKATIVAARIRRPTRSAQTLSPLLQASVEAAAIQVIHLLEAPACTNLTSVGSF